MTLHLLTNFRLNSVPGCPTNKKGRTITVHGFRSTFRDWVAEAPSHSFTPDLAEAAMAHTLGKVERAYQRGDRLESYLRLDSSEPKVAN